MRSSGDIFPTLSVFFFITIFFAFLSAGVSLAETRPLVKDQYLPNLPFTDSLPKDERTYLGLSSGKKFSLKDIRCSVIIIEVFNTYCTSCPRNIPVIKEVYSRSKEDPKFQGKIKIIGIAAGNTREEILSYKKTHGISYPIFSDLNFTLHKALGNPRVPYTILIKKNSRGKDKIIYTHQGIIDSTEPLLEIVGKHLN